MPIKTHSRVLFLGDSITGCGRDRKNSDDMGNGYVARVYALFF